MKKQQPVRPFLNDITAGKTLKPAAEKVVSPLAQEAISKNTAKALVWEEFKQNIEKKRANQDEDHNSSSNINEELEDFAVDAPKRKRKGLILGGAPTAPAENAKQGSFDFATIFDRRLSEMNLPTNNVPDEEDNFPEDPVVPMQPAPVVVMPPVPAPIVPMQPAPVAAMAAPAVNPEDDFEQKKRRLSEVFSSIKKAPVEAAPVAAMAAPAVNNIDEVEQNQRRLNAALFASINVAKNEEVEPAPVVAAKPAQVGKAAPVVPKRPAPVVAANAPPAPPKKRPPAPVLPKAAPAVKFDAKANEEADLQEAARLQALEEKNARAALARQNARKQQEEADARLAQELQAEEQNVQSAREQQLAKVREEQRVQAEKAKAQQKQLDEAANQVERARAAQVAEGVRNQMLEDLFYAAIQAACNSHTPEQTNIMGKICRDLIENGGEINNMRTAINTAFKAVFLDENPSNTTFRNFMLHHFNSTTSPEAVEFRKRVVDNIIAKALEDREMANLFEEGNLVKRNAGRVLGM